MQIWGLGELKLMVTLIKAYVGGFITERTFISACLKINWAHDNIVG
jgi:hypothetical protein